MKKVKNIGILGDQFITWGGGIDFLRLVINGLNHMDLKEEQKVNVVVFLPDIHKFNFILKNALKRTFNVFIKNKLPLRRSINIQSIVNLFKDTRSDIKVITYNGKENSLADLAIKLNIDVLLPSFNCLKSTFPVAWIGYIYDFQHMYHPEFFTSKEVERRNSEFRLMLETATRVIVNAAEVEKDIRRFFPDAKSKVVSLPFCPVVNMNFFDNPADLQKYELPKKYFLISNQFWKHKNHATAFKAFKSFLEKIDDKEFGLVCTGQIYDERFPFYFKELQDLLSVLEIEKNVKILGYIPKNDQLKILKNCVGVIQPTLFEGGPGGGAIYEAVAYGIPSLVSDIAVNRELDDETVTFFNAKSSVDLAKKMEALYVSDRKIYTKEEIVSKNQIALERLGTKILTLIN